MAAPPLSEDAARDLPQQAGDTIEVEAVGPLDTSREPRRRGPALVVAAAALLLVLGVVVLGVPGNSAPERDEPLPADVGPAPSPPPAAGPGTVPGIFGLRRGAAVELLTGLGYRVAVTVRPCERGFVSPFDAAISTRPFAGTTLPPGRTVRVLLSSDCPTASLTVPTFAAWQLVDLARNGRSGTVSFAPEVELSLGSASATLTAAQAADPTRWGLCDGDDCRSALTEIVRAAATPALQGGEPYRAEPYLAYRQIGDSRSWDLDVAVPSDGVDVVDLLRFTLDERSRISAVELTAPRPVEPEGGQHEGLSGDGGR